MVPFGTKYLSQQVVVTPAQRVKVNRRRHYHTIIGTFKHAATIEPSTRS